MKPKVKDDKNILSRRSFIATAGSFMTGAVATAAGCSMMAKKEPAKEEQITWPYPYVKLDPEDIRKRAYAGYYKGK
jgi:hypothetical protein